MMTIPPFARVRHSVPQPQVVDVAATVRRVILESRLATRVPRGGSIAVGVGSRGITSIPTVAHAAVDTLREMGFKPFIIAAMGSHGGATAEGQRALLAGYGITTTNMDVEIRTEMDVVELGTNHVGLPIFFDRNAAAADGIVLINRIKPHTDFTGTYESGVLKMLAIGLGKREGATQIHKLGMRGMREVLPEVMRFLVSNTKFSLGIGILENVLDLPAEIVPLEPETILDEEPILLERARNLMGRLPFDQLDVLIVGELGKNYSGSGLDPNVIGRLMIETMADHPRPSITRLAVLDASDETHGNIVGVGFADLITERLIAKLDPEPFRINILTSCCLERGRIPLTLADDRQVIAAAFATCWRIDPLEARAVVIPNTLELASMWVSPALVAEVDAHPHLSFASEYQPLPFHQDDHLDQEALFPDSVRGRRGRGAYTVENRAR